MNHSRGFGATIAILIMSLGLTTVILVVSGATISYRDSVDRREYRLIRTLNEKACALTTDLIRVKDIHASGTRHLREFGCDITL